MAKNKQTKRQQRLAQKEINKKKLSASIHEYMMRNYGDILMMIPREVWIEAADAQGIKIISNGK